MKIIKKLVLLCFALMLVSIPSLLGGCGDIMPALELKTSFKTEYYIGELLDTTNGVLTYTNNKGEKIDIDITSNMVAGFDSKTAGQKTMTVASNGLSISVDYQVKNYIDVNLERLYYSSPSVFTGGQADKYFYIYFDENKEDLYIFISNITPQNALTGVDNYIKDDHTKYEYEKIIVEGKAIYKISIVTEGYPTTNYTIAVKNQNTITVSVEQGTITATEDLIMYDGVQYQKLYYSNPSVFTQNDPANSYDYVYFATSTEVYVWASSKKPSEFDPNTDLKEVSLYSYTTTSVGGKEVYNFSTSSNDMQLVAKDINTITLMATGTLINFDLMVYYG